MAMSGTAGADPVKDGGGEIGVQHSASSNYYYPGGNRLEANVWIETFADWNGCGDWLTSAKLWGNNPSLAAWIKNTASFRANGVGASIWGASLSGNGTDMSASWTNTNAWISDLAGNVCANWLTWYVSAASTATSYVPQYGSPRITTASV
jgi:hypothetical protein